MVKASTLYYLAEWLTDAELADLVANPLGNGVMFDVGEPLLPGCTMDRSQKNAERSHYVSRGTYADWERDDNP